MNRAAAQNSISGHVQNSNNSTIVASSKTQRTWWKDGTVYQIYPASFRDSNGDGVGDIPGIIQSLDYLRDLGVDIIWVCPFYASPQFDMGYDVSNYEDVYPPYGTLSDVETLIAEVHKRGMKILIDLVINHTSYEHKWFLESSANKTNPKRDWYHWRPAKYNDKGERMPPNNWRCHFGDSAWEWHEGTQEYYLHLFVPEQPDLNWENEETRKAIYDSSMRFWLDRGVDGFRIDTVNMYSKLLDFPDAPVRDPSNFLQRVPGELFCNGPRMHEYLSEMNDVFSEYEHKRDFGGIATVGELPHTKDPAKVLKYVSAAEKQLSMVFAFELIDLGQGAQFRFDTVPYRAVDVKNAVARWQDFLRGTDAWTTNFMENHDQSRSISRYCSDAPADRVVCGKLLALLNATLSGTLFIYQGQEIGMINAPEEWGIEEYKDVEATNYYNLCKSQRLPTDPLALKKAMQGIQAIARDNTRTPMQWTSGVHAGFTSPEATPWMRVMDNCKTINVEDELSQEGSVLKFWQQMLRVRKELADVFVHGDFELLDMENKNTITYMKSSGKIKVLVVLNFTGVTQKFVQSHGLEKEGKRLLIGNMDGAEENEQALRPWEGRSYILQ